MIDGCPPGLPLTPEEIQSELNRRRPGQSDIVTPRLCSLDIGSASVLDFLPPGGFIYLTHSLEALYNVIT